MAKPKVSVRKIYNLVKEAESRTTEGIRIGLLGSKKFFPIIKDALGSDPLSCVIGLEEKKHFADCDLVIIAIDKADEAKEFSKILKSPKTSSIIAINQVDDLSEESNVKKLEGLLGLERIIFLREADVNKRLKNLIVKTISDKNLSIGRLLPGFRDVISLKIINNTSMQNAGIALAFFLPGSDMPPLTLNQMKMVVELAALYGLDLSASRIKELIAILASGYLFRGAARQLLTLLPGPGWTVKTGVAYVGTLSLGHIAKNYFEREAEVIADKT